MNLFPLILFVSGLTLLALTRGKSDRTNVRTGAFPGTAPGQLYRVRVSVPKDYVQAVRSLHGELGQKMLLQDIERRVEHAYGFERTLLSMQDPTTSATREPVFTLITRGRGPGEGGSPFINVQSAEPVDEPFMLDKLYVTNRDALDSGLSPEEIITVRQVLLEDMNPRHLNGVAYTFEPFFPIAASLLRAKADLLDVRKTREAKSSPALDAEAQRAIKSVYEASHGLSNFSVPSDLKEKLLLAQGQLRSLSRVRNIPIEIVEDELRRVACLLIEQDEQEDINRFPSEIVKAAALLVRPIFQASGRIIRIIDPNRLQIILPPKASDGFVSPSAIQLALATNKPQSAGVFKMAEARKVFESLVNAPNKDPQVLKARAQMEKASRCIERRRWVDWWRRKIAARTSTGRA